MSERPQRCRTWAPRGQTPVLQYHFRWKWLSAVAGVTWWNFYFRLFPGTVRSPQVVEFLTHLLRHLHGPVLVIWDRLQHIAVAWSASSSTPNRAVSPSSICRPTRPS